MENRHVRLTGEKRRKREHALLKESTTCSVRLWGLYAAMSDMQRAQKGTVCRYGAAQPCWAALSWLKLGGKSIFRSLEHTKLCIPFVFPHPSHFRLTLVKPDLDSGAPLWVTVCLLDQSLPPKGQVMPRILTRLSEPRQELVNLRSKSHRDLADQQQFTRDYHVVVQLVSFSPGMTALRLAHLWSVAGSRISFTKFEEYHHISLIGHWKTLAIPVIPTGE